MMLIRLINCRITLLAGLSLLTALPLHAQSPKPVVANKITDVVVSGPAQLGIALTGYVGERMKTNIDGRLLRLNVASILEPYVHRPGAQSWAGEHVGKYLYTATYAWRYTGDARIKDRLDSVAHALIGTQLADGYLGTYLDKDRWTDWDVWSHKYNLIGLLTYYGATGNGPALESSRRMGDLLVQTFGPGRRDIIKAGWHVGMAATSVLEPMVMLYRYTGERRYLEFCQYIVQSWEQPNGPHILSSLLTTGSVYKTANGKAYEMLSNLVGLIDLYRMTGDKRYFEACRNAWQDVLTSRHYPTGTSSWGEHFQDDYSLRPDGEVHGDKFEAGGEGCVTVTWLQLSWHLLQLTGESAYADEIERIMYNGLLGAESPRDGSVCYFIPMNGRKRFGEVTHGILPDICCCASSIPRGIALLPELVAGSIRGEGIIWQYVPGRYVLPAPSAPGGLGVRITTNYPADSTISLTIDSVATASRTAIPLLLRVPAWCTSFRATVGSETMLGKPGQVLRLSRVWKAGDQVKLNLAMPLRILPSPDRDSRGVVLERGPQVLAADDRLDTVERLPPGWVGSQFYKVRGRAGQKEITLRMVPFADAGQTGGQYETLINPLTNLHLVR